MSIITLEQAETLGHVNPDQHTCPKCGRRQYLAGRLRGCSDCRGIEPIHTRCESLIRPFRGAVAHGA
jgi:hypothetical protein